MLHIVLNKSLRCTPLVLLRLKPHDEAPNIWLAASEAVAVAEDAANICRSLGDRRRPGRTSMVKAFGLTFWHLLENIFS